MKHLLIITLAIATLATPAFAGRHHYDVKHPTISVVPVK